MNHLKGSIELFSEEDRRLWPEAKNWSEQGEAIRIWMEPVRLDLDNGIVLAASNGMKAWFDFGGCIETEESYIRTNPISSREEALRLLDLFFRIVDVVTHDHIVNNCGFELE